MLTPPRRLLASLALAASAALTVSPAASALGSLGPSGSLGSSVSLGSSESGSLDVGSLGSLAPAPEYETYVALGDSYAALGDQSRTVAGAGECGNSETNYPNVLDADPRVGELTDASCGGAQIPDVVAKQLATLTPDTDLVTLSIGGNDVGFSAMVGCITRQGPFAELPPTTPCETAVGAQVNAGIAAVYGDGGALDTLYEQIETRAPDATVVATQYLPLMPATTPEAGACAFLDRLVPADVEWAREVTAAINAAVDAAAERNGHDSVLPTDTVDRSACAPADQRWTDFLGGAPTNAAAMHPTTLGQQVMADAIAATL